MKYQLFVSLLPEQIMKIRITYYLNLYHHFGKGLYECWML
jgi:hypothetical protein